MKIEGTVVEIGDLDGLTTPGIRIEHGDQIIEIVGLSREQIKAMPNLLFKRVAVSIEPAT